MLLEIGLDSVGGDILLDYFGEDETYVLAECKFCEKVVKVPKDICVQTTEGLKTKNTRKCVCGQEFNLINGVAKSLSPGIPVINIIAHGNSFDIELHPGDVLIKKKGLVKKEILVGIPDLFISEYNKPGLLQPGKMRIICLIDNKKKEFFTYFSKQNLSQFEQIYFELNRYVRETQGTCSVCKHNWYFNMADILREKGKRMKDTGKDLLALGFLPLALIPNEQIRDLERCPKCGSRAVTLRDVINRK